MSKAKVKKYEYESKKTQQQESKIDKKKGMIALAVLGVLMLTVVILICIEQGMRNKIVVKNKSSHNITALNFWYEDEEGQITEIMDLGAVAAKQKMKMSTESQNLSELVGEAWLSIHVAFEDGGEALVQTGQFLYGFNGKISFEIDDTKEEDLIVRLKAGEGLFNSTAVTGCDDVYYINPKDGYIE